LIVPYTNVDLVFVSYAKESALFKFIFYVCTKHLRRRRSGMSKQCH